MSGIGGHVNRGDRTRARPRLIRDVRLYELVLGGGTGPVEVVARYDNALPEGTVLAPDAVVHAHRDVPLTAPDGTTIGTAHLRPGGTMTGVIPAAVSLPDVGECAACGQPLFRTTGDCWHPWYVTQACPPERPLADTPPGEQPWTFGDGYLRPGADQWRPVTAERRDEIIRADRDAAARRDGSPCPR